MNPGAHGRTHEEGTQLIQQLWNRDLTLSASPHAVDVGLGEMANPLWRSAPARFQYSDRLDERIYSRTSVGLLSQRAFRDHEPGFVCTACGRRKRGPMLRCRDW